VTDRAVRPAGSSGGGRESSATELTRDGRSPGDMAEASGPPGLSKVHATSPALERQPTSAAPEIVPPEDGQWIDRWISSERLSRYLHEAEGDRIRALALYEWNTQISASFHRDLAHVEVALRNAYDGAAAGWKGPGHWLIDGYPILFAPVMRTKRQQQAGEWTRRRVDINAKPRALIEKAIHNAGGSRATPGKVVAELTFGFWRYLSSSAHEKSLWVPLLHRAFPPRTRRMDVDSRVGRLYELRNRTAHHEPLFGEDVAGRVTDLLTVAELLQPELSAHVRATSTVLALAAVRP